jgi:hypothetical protein
MYENFRWFPRNNLQYLSYKILTIVGDDVLLYLEEVTDDEGVRIWVRE